MSLRVDYRAVDPAGFARLLEVENHVRSNGLEKGLKNLIYIRASQLNGCAFCLDMHIKEAREAGETDRRLFALPVWRETSFFDERERSVLALTERITLVAEAGVSDEIYADVARFFDAAQIVQLILAIGTINMWNRLSISVGAQPPA